MKNCVTLFSMDEKSLWSSFSRKEEEVRGYDLVTISPSFFVFTVTVRITKLKGLLILRVT
jgi:hypothetical protein